MEKTLNINVPEGYEIDKEKSTIVFKKIGDVVIKWNKNYNGVEIHANGEHFVVDANPSYTMTWDDAMRFYKHKHRSHTWQLPTKKHLEIISKHLKTINKVIAEHNGFIICGYLWTSVKYNPICAWAVDVDEGNADCEFTCKYGDARAVSVL